MFSEVYVFAHTRARICRIIAVRPDLHDSMQVGSDVRTQSSTAQAERRPQSQCISTCLGKVGLQRGQQLDVQ